MIFGPVPTLQAKGNILAHSIVCSGRRLRKGMELEGGRDLQKLQAIRSTSNGLKHIIIFMIIIK